MKFSMSSGAAGATWGVKDTGTTGRRSQPMRTATLLALSLALPVAAIAAEQVASLSVPRPNRSPLVDKVRAATARYQDINVALNETPPFVVGTPCVTGPNEGAMGVHLVRPDRIFDGVLNAEEPEALIYEPEGGNTYRFVGVEFIAAASTVDPGPSLEEGRGELRRRAQSLRTAGVLRIARLGLGRQPQGKFRRPECRRLLQQETAEPDFRQSAAGPRRTVEAGAGLPAAFANASGLCLRWRISAQKCVPRRRAAEPAASVFAGTRCMLDNVREIAGRPAQTFSPGPSAHTRLLERDAFLASLSADLAAATTGAGRCVLVSGEAGIGKTSLLEHFLRTHSTERVLWGACEALFTPHPLGPLHDLARQSNGRLRKLLGDGSNTAVLFGAVFDELVTAPAPTKLLVIEDIQWADAATLDLIKFLGRRIHLAPALMILSYRDDELDPTNLLRSTLGHLPSRHVTRLPLPRLSPAAVTLLAGSATRSDENLYAVTGGNPFFVTEVLASPDGGVPATVRDAVLSRASNLGAAARDVLALVSIAPRAIETWLVESLLGAPVEALEECVASGLLLAEPRMLRFRHELARVAVAESLPRQRARRLHAKVLAALERSPEAIALARLVHHADLAEDSATVLRLAPLAAREAAARGARREAAAHCRMALTLAHRLADGDRAALLDDYASHCFELDDLANAILARETAIELFGGVGDLRRQSEALSRHAMPLVRALRNADADAASRRAIAIAATLPPGPRLGSELATEAWLRMHNRDYADAVAWGHKAIALAQQHGDDETLAVACNCVGAALLYADYARGCQYLQAALRIAGTLADGGVRAAEAYAVLGAGSCEVHEFAIADRFLREGIAFARARDLDRLADCMQAWQALVNMYLGRWRVAGEQALQHLHCPAAPDRLTALVALGRLRTRRGDSGADEALDLAQGLADQNATLQSVAPVRCARAEAAWLTGDLARVRREARAAFDLASDQGHPWFAGELAYWLWRGGELTRAPAACAGPFALQIGGRWREAAAAWETIGCPYEQARALADGDEAAQREALVIFDRLGASPMADRLRQQMRAAGVRAVPRGPRASTRGNSAGLTAREVQVLALVANGWQNARIAARLSRSPRTVEHHLAGILSKLHARSRNEAVARALACGILPDLASSRHDPSGPLTTRLTAIRQHAT